MLNPIISNIDTIIIIPPSHPNPNPMLSRIGPYSSGIAEDKNKERWVFTNKID